MTPKERAADFAFRYEIVGLSSGEIIDKRRLSEAVERTIVAVIEECAMIADKQAALHHKESERLFHNEDEMSAELSAEWACRTIANEIRARSQSKRGNDDEIRRD